MAPWKNCITVPCGPDAGRWQCLAPSMGRWMDVSFLLFCTQPIRQLLSALAWTLPSSSWLCNSLFILNYISYQTFPAPVSSRDKIQEDGGDESCIEAVNDAETLLNILAGPCPKNFHELHCHQNA